MREKRNFAERTRLHPTSEARKKYFLVYEGKDTEDIYFESVNSCRDKIGINPLIELVPVIRSYSEEGWSNPKKILERIRQDIEEAYGHAITYETLLNWIMDYLSEEGILTNNRPAASYMWARLKTICEEKLQVGLYDLIHDPSEACFQIVNQLKSEDPWSSIIEDVPKIIENRSITYDRELDKVCFIIDRDKESFVSRPENDQYQYVLQQCCENGFGFYLSNPSFEFWLLLHFDEVKSLDMAMLLENPKVSARRRYTEQELRKLLPGYSKSRYPVSTLMERIDRAIENEKNFCEDAEELEHSVGSRVGLLMEELRTQDVVLQ